MKEAANLLRKESTSAHFFLRDLEAVPELPQRVVGEIIADLTLDMVERFDECDLPTGDLRNLCGSSSVPEFKRSLKRLLGLPAFRDQLVVVALDEMEYLCNPTLINQSAETLSEVTQFLGALRALVQETENFAFLMSGMTPAPIREGMLYGRHNPLYEWATSLYVQPFDFADAEELVTTLGRRMGLEWERAAVERVHRATGGHAFFMRRLCGIVSETIPLDAEPRVVQRHVVDECVERWKTQIGHNRRQIFDQLETFYPREYRLLMLLREDRARLSDDRVFSLPLTKNLVELGLIRPSQGSLEIAEFL